MRAHLRLGAEFHRLWAATAWSSLEDGLTSVAAPLLAAALTQDPMLVAGLAFAQRLPWLNVTPVSGTLADRLDRRRTMLSVSLVRAGLIAVVAGAAQFGLATLPLLYGVFFLIGCGETLFDTSAAAMLPSVVPLGDLPRANARLSGTITLGTQFVGRPLGGLLFARAAALPFLAGTFGLVLAAALLAALRGTFVVAPASPAATSLRAEIVAGMRWLLRQRLLGTLSVALAVMNLTLVAQNAVIVLYAEQRLGIGPQGFGVLVSVYGVGGILGSLVAHRWLQWWGTSRALRLAILAEVAYPLGMAVLTAPVGAGLRPGRCESAWAGTGESDLARLEFWWMTAGHAVREGYTTVASVADDYPERRPVLQLLWCLEYAEHHASAEHQATTDAVCAELGIAPIPFA